MTIGVQTIKAEDDNGNPRNGMVIRGRDILYYKDGLFHREDGPAKIYHNYGDKEDGDYQEYWLKGRLHRTDGPALEANNLPAYRIEDFLGTNTKPTSSWWIDGIEYKTIDEWARALGIFDTDEFTMMKLMYE